MSTSSEYDFAGHDDRIRQHYDHAREKHPYFCDWSPLVTTEYFKRKATEALLGAREELKFASEANEVEWIEVLECEKYEAVEALANGDKARAVEDLYDMIAVCLRAIDVLEGRQKLGKPEEKLPPCTCGGKAVTVERGTEPEGFAIMCSRCFRKTALHPSLALAEEEWRTILSHNTTTKKGGAK